MQHSSVVCTFSVHVLPEAVVACRGIGKAMAEMWKEESARPRSTLMKLNPFSFNSFVHHRGGACLHFVPSALAAVSRITNFALCPPLRFHGFSSSCLLGRSLYRYQIVYFIAEVCGAAQHAPRNPHPQCAYWGKSEHEAKSQVSICTSCFQTN